MRDALHSRIVGGLKLLLPLVALGLLSTVFLLSRTDAPATNVPFLDAAPELAGGDAVSAPYYAGSTPEGHGVAIVADTAYPQADDPDRLRADKLRAQFDLNDGTRIDVIADTALVDEPDDLLVLSGDVVIQSSQGYVVRTQRLSAAFRRIEAMSPAPVAAEGPIGTLDAGAFEISQSEETSTTENGAKPARVRMVFTNGVKLVYQPKTQESVDP